MAVSLKQLLPSGERSTKNAQGRVPPSLYDKADAIRRKRRLNWAQVMTALLEKFCYDLEERPSKPEKFQLDPLDFNPDHAKSHWK